MNQTEFASSRRPGEVEDEYVTAVERQPLPGASDRVGYVHCWTIRPKRRPLLAFRLLELAQRSSTGCVATICAGHGDDVVMPLPWWVRMRDQHGQQRLPSRSDLGAQLLALALRERASIATTPARVSTGTVHEDAASPQAWV